MFFEASCDLHDFGYWKGGDEARRAECDRKFYEKILEDINSINERTESVRFSELLANEVKQDEA